MLLAELASEEVALAAELALESAEAVVEELAVLLPLSLPEVLLAELLSLPCPKTPP